MEVKKKTIEQFRAEIVDAIHAETVKETAKSVRFIRTADYLNAKLSEAKIAGFHFVLGVVIDASTVSVKEK